MLKVVQSELEEHLSRTYSDDLRSVPLGERQDIPTVPLPTNSFNLAVPSYEEVKSLSEKPETGQHQDRIGSPTSSTRDAQGIKNSAHAR